MLRRARYATLRPSVRLSSVCPYVSNAANICVTLVNCGLKLGSVIGLGYIYAQMGRGLGAVGPTVFIILYTLSLKLMALVKMWDVEFIKISEKLGKIIRTQR